MTIRWVFGFGPVVFLGLALVASSRQASERGLDSLWLGSRLAFLAMAAAALAAHGNPSRRSRPAALLSVGVSFAVLIVIAPWLVLQLPLVLALPWLLASPSRWPDMTGTLVWLGIPAAFVLVHV